MWIAIAYERVTSVITWNLAPTKDEAVLWVIHSMLPKNMDPPESGGEALAVIESEGFEVQIEEVTHLATSTEYAMRMPNELVLNRSEDHQAVYRNARQADEKLRAAGSAERVTVVSREALHTDWREVL